MSNRLTAHYRKVTISAHLEQEQWQLSPASDRHSTTLPAWHALLTRNICVRLAVSAQENL